MQWLDAPSPRIESFALSTAVCQRTDLSQNLAKRRRRLAVVFMAQHDVPKLLLHFGLSSSLAASISRPAGRTACPSCAVAAWKKVRLRGAEWRHKTHLLLHHVSQHQHAS
jgi:hypothetical protein